MNNAKVRSRKCTSDQIQLAIAQVQAEPGKVTISAVARVAGISPALIHNTYPDLAEKIRGLAGKGTRMQRDAKHDSLVIERETNRTLRQELAQVRTDFARLASVNQVLLNEVALLKGVATGKVVALIQSR